MMHIAAIILVTWVFTGCKDIPYKEPGSTLNLDVAIAKNAVPVESVGKESARTDHAQSITDAPSRNIESPSMEPDVIEIEDNDSDNRGGSNRRNSSNNIVPPVLPPANVDLPLMSSDTVEEARNSISPTIEIISPTNNSLIAGKQFEVKGSLEHPELVQNIIVRYQVNNLIVGEKNANKAENNFSATFEDLADGDYGISVVFVDINGIEHLLPELKVSIDGTPPKILGAFDGIVQPAYLHEDMQFEQKFIDDASNPRYEIAPIGEASPLKYETTPTIYRWFTRIYDEKTAPIYVFKISDTDVADVKYAIDLECASFEKVLHEAVKQEDGRYEIKIIPNTSDLNLDGKKFCLSIWATDLAGNKAHHQAEFIWKISAPPMALDMNAARYNASTRRDDVSWADLPARQLFRDTIPIALKRDLVVGHTIISNPFPSPLAVKLEMKKPINLKINPRFYNIPANSVVIKYFAYDLAKNEIGLEKMLNDGFVTIDGNETLVAKFILAREFSLTGIRHPKRSFWRSFSLDVGFLKSVNSGPLVDGLSLITRDSVAGLLSNEFVVPWGENHQVRKKSAPRERGRR